ncbi:MAG: hypothetical protein WB660_11285 [Candidatus Sulfotelmatobacter sp.]
MLANHWNRYVVNGKALFASRRENLPLRTFVACALLVLSTPILFAENCLTSTDMDAATRTALTNTALHYFDLIAKGDTASLRQSSIPSLAGDFSGIEGTVKQNQPALAGAKATARPPFLLEAEGTATIPRAEFFCGVFGRNGQTSDSAAFSLNGLAPGKYAVVILDAPSAKGAYMVSQILQQQGSDWKLGGLYIKNGQFNGHDNNWFITHAHDFQTKGQTHNAWLYYLVARSLISPLPFMSTAATDKLYDDSQKLQPADFPTDSKTADLSAGTAGGSATYKLTALFPEVVGNDLDLIVRYQAADVSNPNQTYQNNVAVMKALLTKYPELRDAFAAVVARAVDPNGHDYGTMLAMKDIK